MVAGFVSPAVDDICGAIENPLSQFRQTFRANLKTLGVTESPDYPTTALAFQKTPVVMLPRKRTTAST